jgi:hypothetical protein
MSLNNINCLICMMETVCVYCEARTEIFEYFYVKFQLPRVRYS